AVLGIPSAACRQRKRPLFHQFGGGSGKLLLFENAVAHGLVRRRQTEAADHMARWARRRKVLGNRTRRIEPRAFPIAGGSGRSVWKPYLRFDANASDRELQSHFVDHIRTPGNQYSADRIFAGDDSLQRWGTESFETDMSGANASPIGRSHK